MRALGNIVDADDRGKGVAILWVLPELAKRPQLLKAVYALAQLA